MVSNITCAKNVVWDSKSLDRWQPTPKGVKSMSVEVMGKTLHPMWNWKDIKLRKESNLKKVWENHQRLLRMGKMVSMFLQNHDYLFEQDLSEKHKQALPIYRWEDSRHFKANVILKPWREKVMTFLKMPIKRQVIWIQGKRGHKGKTFVRHYIKFYFGGR